MTIKRYITPTLELIEADMNEQLLAGSIATMTSDGLDGDNLILDGDGSDAADAMTRLFMEGDI